MYFYDDSDEEDETSVEGGQQEDNGEETSDVGSEESDEDEEGGEEAQSESGSSSTSRSAQDVVDEIRSGSGSGKGESEDGTSGSKKTDGGSKPGEEGHSKASDRPEDLKTGGKKPGDLKTGGGGLDKGNIAAAALKGAGEDGGSGALKEGSKEAAKQIAKDQAKKQLAKMGGEAFLNSLSAALAPILFWVAIIILIIIIVVGIIMFFVAVPGQIIGKFKNIGNGLLKAWSAMVQGGDEVVSVSEIAEVANYVEKMGYDLKGEGFVSFDKTDIDDTINNVSSWTSIDYNSELSDMGADALKDLLIVDPIQGVIRRNDTNEIIDINSDPILTYIVSDNQCYMIKNFNNNLDDMSGGNGDFWGNLLAAVAVIAGVVVAILVPGGIILSVFLGAAAAAGVAGASYLAVTLQSNPDWGSGLISIYHEAGMGKKGDYYEQIEKGSIFLDANTKKLSIQRGWSNGAYTFDVDGWSGRYGMPLEFLLSVHLATQMPDLAVDMATSFDTDVEVLLHKVNGDMTAGVLKEGATGTADDDFITYETISNLGHEEASFWQGLWEGLKDFANGTVNFFTGDTLWTEEELEELGINAKVMTILFEDGFPHSSECECCSHIPGHKSNPEEEECSDIDSIEDLYGDDGKIANPHKICPKCQDRLARIVAALAVSNDKDWESYTPYISKVTDHWFRDVYFVMNADDYDENGESEFSKSVVQVDEDYFYETNERWTMYETWEEGDNIPEGFEVGDYKLYEPSNMNVPSTKTLKEVQEINEKIANGDTSVTRLVKKAIQNKMQKTEGIDGFDGWSAYNLTDSETGDELPWTKMSVTKDSKGELLDPAVYKDENAENPDNILIYYKETRPGDVKQVEDGQRTETNPKIKKMFLDNTYYKYDGSTTTADAILEDRQKDGNDPANYNTENDQRDEKLTAKVNITKDSLGAFSILENTHTLDADYIYRDFKELIVELNYFDKEDLSDKIGEVMQWPIPECGSAGWPIRKYEKGETFYGTLINSKVDLDYMKDLDVKKAEVTLSKLEGEVEETETDVMNGVNVSNLQTDTTGGLATSGNLVTDSGLTGSASSAPSISIDQFVQTGYDVHAIMDQGSEATKDWDYCVLTDQGSGPHMAADCPDPENCGNQHCDTYGPSSSHSCALSATIQDAATNKNTCCATFTSWVLKEAGFDLSDHTGMHSAPRSYKWCKENGWTEITSLDDMEAGDFLFNHGSDVNHIGHVQMLGNDGEWLNGGSISAINKPASAYTPDSFIIGMRPPLNGAGKPFEGYEPDQAVVAPITGKVVDYGLVERTNEETGEKETVDFIKIQAIDNYITSQKGKTVLSQCTDEDKTYKDNNTDTSKTEGYDYFYEEYRGVIDGCVLYMEGFDLTIDETLGASDMESDEVTKYEGNQVYNMTNNVKEAQALWREDAKSAALPFFKNGEDLYIKEGTVIGKTLADPDDFPPEIAVDESGMPTAENPKGSGNYIRLILRDLEDSIMEDVESYFPIDDTNKSQTQPYKAQPGDLELLANLLHHEGCESYFATRSVFSGKPEQARDASRVTGYVLLNRAILNYGGHGTTIREQILAPGQYSTAYDVTEGEADYCDKCLANAEWCLTYDCNSVISPSSNTPMPRNVVGQSGWCQCSADIGKFNCWWWVDTTGDGAKTEHSGPGSAFDTFYCINTQFPSS